MSPPKVVRIVRPCVKCIRLLEMFEVLTEAEVRSQLATDDKAASAQGQLSRYKMTPSNFITLGLAIEETQYVIGFFCTLKGKIELKYQAKSEVGRIE